jgi:hypothetical protein
LFGGEDVIDAASGYDRRRRFADIDNDNDFRCSRLQHAATVIGFGCG